MREREVKSLPEMGRGRDREDWKAEGGRESGPGEKAEEEEVVNYGKGSEN